MDNANTESIEMNTTTRDPSLAASDQTTLPKSRCPGCGITGIQSIYIHPGPYLDWDTRRPTYAVAACSCCGWIHSVCGPEVLR